MKNLLAQRFRRHGAVRYRERRSREWEAAASFKDWNRPQFLDTAELPHAIVMAYERWRLR